MRKRYVPVALQRCEARCYPSNMPNVVNIASYQFAPLGDLPALRQRLLGRCKAWSLRGTILLSAEGINLFVAGGRSEIDALLDELQAIPGLADFSPKVSVSDEQPFRRMLVRIKKEIIAFGVPGIEPAQLIFAETCAPCRQTLARRRPPDHAARYAQRLRGETRYVPQRRDARNRSLPEFSRSRESVAG